MCMHACVLSLLTCLMFVFVGAEVFVCVAVGVGWVG